MRIRGRLLIVLSAVWLVAETALARQLPAPPAPAVVEPGADPAYVLAPADVIEIKFFYNSELNETVIVRPDGRISMQLVNDIQAAGRTPSELRADLMRLYAVELKQPELAVIVRHVAPRRLYVGGEVRAPAMLKMEGRLSLMQAIFEAGGVTRAGKVSDVVILRYRGTPEPEFIKVDMRAAFERGDRRGDLELQPLDIVWVPRTKIARVNDFMEQYVRQLIPLPLTMGVTYLFGGLVQ
jgi:polysaccharide export outer membrane protein